MYYHGLPYVLASGFGGFYFSSGIAFNLGVGIGVNPPTLGRVWFPCFDNFVQRSHYEFFITSKFSHKAFCNGILLDMIADTVLQQKTWHYKLSETIPTYLACVAVGAYETIHQTFTAINGSMPVELAALANDTTLLKNCFTHLENAFDYFEEAFGPYRWEKVGYSLVPFNGGAMEHATNIAYPRSFVDNAGTYESDLMAHELAHHWFGDLVTCEEPKDMWLNEGWATFCGLYFLEKLHDTDMYMNEVKNKLDNVVHFANYSEGGFQALSNIPFDYTYGTHVYDKGALVAHTLRAYMGNTFFSALTSYMNNNQYQKTNSNYFLNQLELYSGKSLHPFFNNYVFEGGFAHFSVDSFSTTNTGSGFQTKVYIKQKLTGTEIMHTHVPLDFTFYDVNLNKITFTDTINTENSVSNFIVPFDTKFVLVNATQRLSTAQIQEQKLITGNGANAFILGKLSTLVSNFTTNVFLNVEHNYTHPDAFKITPKYRLSPNRYWKITGIIPQGTSIKTTFKYNGRTLATNGDNYLDNLLINETEDSLYLFYRGSTASDWIIINDTIWSRGNKSDKVGSVNVTNLKLGEYCFGMKDQFASIAETQSNAIFDVHIFPNPAKNTLNIIAPNYNTADIYDNQGKLVKTISIKKYVSEYDIYDLENGIYIIKFNSGDITKFKKFIKQ
jgi:aminopeptidase N